MLFGSEGQGGTFALSAAFTLVGDKKALEVTGSERPATSINTRTSAQRPIHGPEA
jgi:hypothetical protein